mgnify:CR=1 FL=1
MLEKGEIEKRKKTAIFRGFEINLANGDTIKLPYIGVGKSSRKFWELLNEFARKAESNNIAEMTEVAFDMFCQHVQKYYEVTKEELEDLIEMPELFKFVIEVQGISEITKVMKNINLNAK